MVARERSGAIGEKRVVHRPEFALLVGGEGSGGGDRRLRVRLEGVLLEDQLDVVRVGLHNRFQLVDGLDAERALEVGELNEGNFGLRGAGDGRASDGDRHLVVEDLMFRGMSEFGGVRSG